MTGLFNSFQTPNMYIDRLMYLLTDTEFRVVMFSSRHVFGWQDRINKRQAHLSATMIAGGFITEKGTVFHGTGLNPDTVLKTLKALAKFSVMLPDEDSLNDPRGQLWTMATEDQIKWVDLEKRHEEKLEKQRQRTAKARKARAAKKATPIVGQVEQVSLSDNDSKGVDEGDIEDTTPIVGQGGGVIVRQVETPIVGQTESNTPSKTLSKTIKDSVAPVGATREKLFGFDRDFWVAVVEHPAHYKKITEDVIAACFGFTWSTMTDPEKGVLRKAAKDLRAVNIKVCEIPQLYNFCKLEFDRFGPAALTTNHSRWRQSQQNGANAPSQPAVKPASDNPYAKFDKPFEIPQKRKKAAGE